MKSVNLKRIAIILVSVFLTYVLIGEYLAPECSRSYHSVEIPVHSCHCAGIPYTKQNLTMRFKRVFSSASFGDYLEDTLSAITAHQSVTCVGISLER